MDRYIGLDAHASSCTVATIGPSGKRLHSRVVGPNAKALVCLREAGVTRYVRLSTQAVGVMVPATFHKWWVN